MAQKYGFFAHFLAFCGLFTRRANKISGKSKLFGRSGWYEGVTNYDGKHKNIILLLFDLPSHSIYSNSTTVLRHFARKKLRKFGKAKGKQVSS
jgi:hypothetical protein